MPIANCIKSGGKIYCYDDENKQVLVYDVAVIALKDCPEDVLEFFVANKNRKAAELSGNR